MDALMFPGMIGMSGGPGLGRPGLQMPRDIRGSQVQTMPREVSMCAFAEPSHLRRVHCDACHRIVRILPLAATAAEVVIGQLSVETKSEFRIAPLLQRMPLFGMPSCPPGPWAAPPVLSAMPRTQPAPDIKAGASVDTDSDSEKRQEKRNGSSNAQAERIARMQEKNRRAQRRFRERQKQKVSTLETRVEELQRENELYRAHGQNLQIRLTAMARAIELLDEECKAWSAGDKAKAEGARSLIQNLQNDTNSGLTLSVGGSTIPIEVIQSPALPPRCPAAPMRVPNASPVTKPCACLMHASRLLDSLRPFHISHIMYR